MCVVYESVVLFSWLILRTHMSVFFSNSRYTEQFMRAYGGNGAAKDTDTPTGKSQESGGTANGNPGTRRSKRFAFWSTQVAHEPSMARLSSLDVKLRDFIRRQFAAAAAEEGGEGGGGGRLMVALLGDHGVSYGEYYGGSKYAQQNEHRPAMFLLTSEGIHRRHPGLALQMRANQGRLTTPWDVYATLSHAQVYPAPPPVHSPEAMGDSLMGTVAANRTCMQLGIGPRFCGCDKWASLLMPERRSDVETLVWLAMRHINHILTSKGRSGKGTGTGTKAKGGGGGGGGGGGNGVTGSRVEEQCPPLRLLRVLEVSFSARRDSVTAKFEVTPDDESDSLTAVAGARVEIMEAIFRVRDGRGDGRDGRDKEAGKRAAAAMFSMWGVGVGVGGAVGGVDIFTKKDEEAEEDDDDDEDDKNEGPSGASGAEGAKRCGEEVSCPGNPILRDRMKRFEVGFLWNGASLVYESVPGFIVLGEQISIHEEYKGQQGKAQKWDLVNTRGVDPRLGTAGEEWRRETLTIKPGTTSQRNWWIADPGIPEGVHYARLHHTKSKQLLAERPILMVQSLFETSGDMRRRRPTRRGLDATAKFYDVVSVRRMSLFDRDKKCSDPSTTEFCLCDG